MLIISLQNVATQKPADMKGGVDIGVIGTEPASKEGMCT